MSDFKFNCPHCQQWLEAPEEMLGETIDCPSCQGSIELPAPEPKVAPKKNIVVSRKGVPFAKLPGPRQQKAEKQPRQEKKMSGFGFDAGAIAAQGKAGNMYIVTQVVLTEKLLGTGSGTTSLTNLQATINNQVAKGYRLHTISTSSSGSKGFLGGDKIQATMVFEKVI
jgi:hypothetical protein